MRKTSALLLYERLQTDVIELRMESVIMEGTVLEPVTPGDEHDW